MVYSLAISQAASEEESFAAGLRAVSRAEPLVVHRFESADVS
jgi:hypothetical protein